MMNTSITKFRHGMCRPSELQDHKVRRRGLDWTTKDQHPWHVWVYQDCRWVQTVYGAKTKSRAEMVAAAMRNTPAIWMTGRAVKSVQMQVREGREA